MLLIENCPVFGVHYNAFFSVGMEKTILPCWLIQELMITNRLSAQRQVCGRAVLPSDEEIKGLSIVLQILLSASRADR